jgi:hypothetical protein
VGVVDDGFLEDDEHFLLIDLVVLVEVGVLDELLDLHQAGLAALPQVAQRVLEQVQDLEVLQPTVSVDVVLLEHIFHCLPQNRLRNIHSEL